MKNSVIDGRAGVPARHWPLAAAAMGTARPGSAGALLAVSGARAMERSRLPEAVAVTRQVPAQKYQHMTRVTVGDGDISGPHPAWDPV